MPAGRPPRDPQHRVKRVALYLPVGHIAKLRAYADSRSIGLAEALRPAIAELVARLPEAPATPNP